MAQHKVSELFGGYHTLLCSHKYKSVSSGIEKKKEEVANVQHEPHSERHVSIIVCTQEAKAQKQ